jgi:hypothetical protein
MIRTSYIFSSPAMGPPQEIKECMAYLTTELKGLSQNEAGCPLISLISMRLTYFDIPVLLKEEIVLKAATLFLSAEA